MSNYDVDLKPIDKHLLPDLLKEFGDWLKTQPHPIQGNIDALHSQKIPSEWLPKAAARLQRDGFVFLDLPDGSMLALITPPAKSPASAHPAVVLLGSEGETKTVAHSLEEFLFVLADANTGINDLDEAEGRADGQKALKQWLKQKKVRIPKTKPFNFAAYLTGGTAPAAPAGKSVATTPAIAELPPLARELALLMGRRADDPILVKFIEKSFGKKVPQSTSANDTTDYVLAPKQGVELCFSHNIKDLPDMYPPIPNGRAFVPYLCLVWFKRSKDPLPYGLTMKEVDNGYGKMVLRLDEDQAKTVLGKPTFVSNKLGRKTPVWLKPLDPKRGVWFRADFFDGASLSLTDGKK